MLSSLVSCIPLLATFLALATSTSASKTTKYESNSYLAAKKSADPGRLIDTLEGLKGLTANMNGRESLETYFDHLLPQAFEAHLNGCLKLIEKAEFAGDRRANLVEQWKESQRIYQTSMEDFSDAIENFNTLSKKFRTKNSAKFIAANLDSQKMLAEAGQVVASTSLSTTEFLLGLRSSLIDSIQEIKDIGKDYALAQQKDLLGKCLYLLELLTVFENVLFRLVEQLEKTNDVKNQASAAENAYNLLESRLAKDSKQRFIKQTIQESTGLAGLVSKLGRMDISDSSELKLEDKLTDLAKQLLDHLRRDAQILFSKAHFLFQNQPLYLKNIEELQSELSIVVKMLWQEKKALQERKGINAKTQAQPRRLRRSERMYEIPTEVQSYLLDESPETKSKARDESVEPLSGSKVSSGMDNSERLWSIGKLHKSSSRKPSDPSSGEPPKNYCHLNGSSDEKPQKPGTVKSASPASLDVPLSMNEGRSGFVRPNSAADKPRGLLRTKPIYGEFE